MNVDGTIHAITKSAKHLIWNDADNEFNQIYDFKQNDDILDIHSPSVIYVKSKQKLFLIGAQIRGPKYPPCGIWTYSLLTNKWERIDYLKFDNYGGSVIKTSDEKYMIIFGCWDKDDSVLKKDRIYVLDIRDDNEYKLRKSAINFPKLDRHNILIRGGEIEHEMLVIAWIADLFKREKFKHLELLPVYLMKLICSWYIQEEIHWIGADYTKNEHFVINAKYIFNNLL